VNSVALILLLRTTFLHDGARRCLRIIDKRSEGRRLRHRFHVQRRNDQQKAIDLPRALGCVIARKGDHHRARAADGPYVDVFRIADRPGGVDCCLDGVLIIGHAPAIMTRLRVAPHHDKNRHSLLNIIFKDAALRGEVEYVIFVDDRGHHQHWPLVHLPGLRSVLNQLEHLGAQNDRTRGDCEIFADLESGFIDLRRNWTPLPHIIEQIRGTARQAEAAGFLQAAKCCRITQKEIAWRQGIADLVQQKACALIEIRIRGITRHRLPHREIALQQARIDRVFLPCRIGKAPVAGIDAMLRLTRRDLSQFAPKTETCLGQFDRMGQRPAGQRTRGVQQIGRAKVAHDVLAVDIFDGTLDCILAIGNLGAGSGAGPGVFGLSCHVASPLLGNGARHE
jgi:hypothetical protein